MMNYLRSLPQKLAKDKMQESPRNSSIMKKAAKTIAATVMAFSAQYGTVMNQFSAAKAAETPAVTQKAETANTMDLSAVDKDYIVADAERLQKNGMYFMNGSPVIAYPFIDPESNSAEKYFTVFENITLGGDHKALVKPLTTAFHSEDGEVLFSTSKSFESNVNLILTKGTLTKEEKERVYYSMAYYWKMMPKWEVKADESGNNVKYQTPRNFDEVNRQFNHYKDLLLESKKDDKDLEAVKSELEMMNLADEYNDFTHMVSDDSTIKSGVLINIKAHQYSSRLQDAATYIESAVDKYKSGDISLENLQFVANIFEAIAQASLKVNQTVFQKGLASDEVYTFMQETSKTAFAALAHLEEVLRPATDANLQLKRQYLVAAEDILGFADYVAKESYSTDTKNDSVSITKDQLASTVNSVYTTSQSILAANTDEQLMMASNPLRTNLETTKLALDKAIGTTYTTLADASESVKALETLFKNHKDNQPWPADAADTIRTALLQAQTSSSAEVQDKLNTFLFEQVQAAKPTMTVDYYEQTGKTYNFSLDPMTREIDGVVVDTTEHPVDEIHAKYTFENKSPVDLPVTVKILYPGTATVVKLANIIVPANKIADVEYEGYLSITSRPNDAKVPEYKYALDTNKLYEVLTASLPAGSAEAERAPSAFMKLASRGAVMATADLAQDEEKAIKVAADLDDNDHAESK